MSVLHARRCRYCREPVGPLRPATVDHYVPKWVLRAYRDKFAKPRNRFGGKWVTACRPCNFQKGLMPAAAFVRARLNPVALKLEYERWSRICVLVGQGQVEEHRALIYAEFSRPLPEHFPIGDKPVILAPSSHVQADWVKG